MKLVVNRVSEVAEPSETDDPFAAFTSETAPRPPAEGARSEAPPRRSPPWSRFARRTIVVTTIVAVLAALAFIGVRQVRARWFAVPTGVLSIASNPSGAEVLIDGVQRGVTPLVLNLPIGGHTVTIRREGVSRDFAVVTKKDVEIAQSVELAPPVSLTGRLSVTSEPAGLTIAVDGIPAGVTPAVIDELKPGTHLLTLTGKSGSAERSVVIAAGTTASLMVTMTTAPAAGIGSVEVVSPIEVQLFEGAELIGSSEAARLYMPVGSHTITAVNEALAFKRSMTVIVKPGLVTRLPVSIPNGSLSVNALPWAEVFIDGKSLGETPIGNYSLPIGPHELVLKHPQLGERRQSVVVAAGRPARVGVDLRQ